MENEEIRLLKNMIDQLREVEEFGMNKIRDYLSGLNYRDLKTTLMQFDDDYLKTICHTVHALAYEKYEICQAAQEILDERLKVLN